MFVFYAIPFACVAVAIGAWLYEAHLARQRSPRPLTPDDVRARLTAAGFVPLPWPTRPYGRERD